MKKKILSIIIVLIIVLNPVIAHAESAPGTISVSGGSVGSGGVEGNSTVLKGTALTVIMATLASAGITIKVAQDDYERGVGAFSYLENKFNEWENQSSQGWANYQALNETKVGADGKLYIPEAASSVLQKFTNWLFANNDVSEMPSNDATTGQYGTYYGTRYTVSTRDYYETTQPSNFAVFRTYSNSSYYMFTFAKTTYTYWRKINGSGYAPEVKQVGEWYYTNSDAYYNTVSNITGLLDISTLGYWGADGVRRYLQNLTEAPPVALNNTGFYGETLDIPQFVDPEDTGKITVVDPGLLQVLQDAYEGSNDTNIGIQDYLDALRDLLGQQALPEEVTDLPDISITGEDATTGTKDEVASIDRDTVTTPGITLPADPIAPTWPEVPPIAVPVADPDVIADPSVAIPAMSFSLTDYFPFCIPFDIYNLLSKLNAEPVTPVIVVDWGNILGSIGVDYEMTIDLSQYDNVAAILRTMELFAFIIGLGVATRSMYIRG